MSSYKGWLVSWFHGMYAQTNKPQSVARDHLRRMYHTMNFSLARSLLPTISYHIKPIYHISWCLLHGLALDTNPKVPSMHSFIHCSYKDASIQGQQQMYVYCGGKDAGDQQLCQWQQGTYILYNVEESRRPPPQQSPANEPTRGEEGRRAPPSRTPTHPTSIRQPWAPGIQWKRHQHTPKSSPYTCRIR